MKKLLSIAITICVLAVTSLTPFSAAAETVENTNNISSENAATVYSTTADTPYGWLDWVTSTYITGWVYLPSSPEIALDVQIVLRNLTTGTTHNLSVITANVYRQGVEEDGFGTGMYGFEYNISWDGVYPGNYEVDAYALVGNQMYLIHGCPKTYTNHGVCRTLSLPDYVMQGATQQLWATFEMSKDTVTFTYSVENVVSVSTAGLLKGIGTGQTYVIATFTDPSTGQTRKNVLNFYCRESLGLSDGTKYYIMNKSSGRFLSLAGNGDADYQNIVTKEPSTSTQAQWALNLETSKSFTIESVLSSTGKTMGCDVTNILLSPSSEIGKYEFAVFRSDNSAYQGLYCIRYGHYFVSEDSNHNVYLTTTATAASFWSFMKVGNGKVGITSFNYTYKESSQAQNDTVFDSRMCNSEVSTVFEDFFGYTGTDIHNNPTVTASFNSLCNDEAYFYFGHGDAGVLHFRKANANGIGEYSYAAIATGPQFHKASNYEGGVEYLEDYDDDTIVDLSQAACVFYFGCYTGNDNALGISLLDETFAKGAHFVLGSTEKLYNSSIDPFVNNMLDNLLDGMSLGEAITCAVDYTGAVKLDDDPVRYGDFPEVHIGDTEQYLNF